MTDLRRSTTLAVRTDPLAAPMAQTIASWPEVLAFLPHLAAAGTAMQLVETPGQVAGVTAGALAPPAPAARTGLG